MKIRYKEEEIKQLPEGWTCIQHQKIGIPFFYHVETGFVCWNRPYRITQEDLEGIKNGDTDGNEKSSEIVSGSVLGGEVLEDEIGELLSVCFWFCLFAFCYKNVSL